MTARASRSAEEAFATAAGDAEAGEATVPVNHPGDSRTYPPGSRIVNGTLELPPSGVSSADRVAEALAAADARRTGRSYESHGVEMGARHQPSADELAAITRKAKARKGRKAVKARGGRARR